VQSVLRAMTARRAPCHRDRGAAAVEFALLLPIFVILVFGGLSAGIIFWHQVSSAQGARDAARYGGTLPISRATSSPAPSGEYFIADWLTSLTSVALREAGIGDSNGDGQVDAADANAANVYVCVGFVKGLSSTHTQSDARLVTLNGSSTQDSNRCIADDGAPTSVDRVQVVVKRDERFSAILFSRSITLENSSVQPYERVIK
jgi:Flp pilus assembly protein TadG